ncbi:MAG: MBL fold metallo-hydrolase, partial [Proteobacteria bacterium]|nr:MBL fold metallo-hydrolase [Pseudomonadota bacterium]
GVKKIITFSGDLGNHRSITMRPPVDLVETDILVLESTYGSRIHARMPGSVLLADVIKRTMERKGVLVIPAFAVGRTQEILFMIRQLEENKSIPSVPVILDSPMATAATKTFLQHPEDHLIDIASNGEPTGFLPRQFETTHSTRESMAACLKDGPFIVISASGMLSGGRILHHLRTRLPNPKNTVLFVGYQAEGSKGHYLLNEGKASGRMRIFHAEVPIGAEVASIDNLSAHADQQDLLEWVGRIQKLPQKIFLNHGTKESADQLAERLRIRFPTVEVTPLAAATAIQIYK